MIDAATIDEAWHARPWPLTSRGMRRFHFGLSAGLGVFFWAFVPFELLGAALSDEYRREMLGYAALNFGLGLLSVGTAVFLKLYFGPEHRAEDALKRQGQRVPGQLVKVEFAPTGGPSIPTHRRYLFGAEVPGGPPVFARLTARWGIPLGCPATIAYDPARPGEGVVVESAAELRRRRGTS